jgi:hypothetical protein
MLKERLAMQATKGDAVKKDSKEDGREVDKEFGRKRRNCQHKKRTVSNSFVFGSQLFD